MRETIIRKIIAKPNTPFGRVVDMTSEERTELRDVMEKAGAGWNMLYQRMVYRGFDQWELTGIDRCTSDFWQSASNSTCPALDLFWQTLVEQGQNTAFVKYMETQGMSRNTTIKRFSEPNFKEWEIDGVERLLHRIQGKS